MLTSGRPSSLMLSGFSSPGIFVSTPLPRFCHAPLLRWPPWRLLVDPRLIVQAPFKGRKGRCRIELHKKTTQGQRKGSADGSR